MIKSIKVQEFKAVPYLETSDLMQSHQGRLKFSSTKPNVLVGPNGTGKSALLKSLSLRFLCHYMSFSSFDDNYVTGVDASDFWTKAGRWGSDDLFLNGLTCDTDNAPALFFRPGHIPGNEVGITHAMMCGYFDAAKAHAVLVDKKSSGQQNQATLEHILKFLTSPTADCAYRYANWRFGKAFREKSSDTNWYSSSSFEHQAEILKKFFAPKVGIVPIPLVLMDEPEQSLDARTEALLWSKIAGVDCAKLQLIVASHSLFPILHPKMFNLIETEKGYVQSVQGMLGLTDNKKQLCTV